jgi:hypothetical protein
MNGSLMLAMIVANTHGGNDPPAATTPQTIAIRPAALDHCRPPRYCDLRHESS